MEHNKLRLLVQARRLHALGLKQRQHQQQNNSDTQHLQHDQAPAIGMVTSQCAKAEKQRKQQHQQTKDDDGGIGVEIPTVDKGHHFTTPRNG